MQLPLVEQVSTAGSVELTQPDADTVGSTDTERLDAFSLLVTMNCPVTALEKALLSMFKYTILELKV